jgi:hypothetical protein
VAKLSAVTTPSLTYDEGAAPSTPAAGKVIQYAKADGLLYSKDDAGTETALGAASVTFSGARAVANAATAIATATWTSVAFAGTDRFDTSSYHDPASNNTRLTVPSNGYYMIGANVQFAGSVTGERGVRIYLGGATILAQEMRTAVQDAALPTRINIVTLYQLSATNYVEVQMWQDSGGSINSENVANSTGEFWITRLG